jgi:uncharacterized protein (TIGR03435 family)
MFLASPAGLVLRLSSMLILFGRLLLVFSLVAFVAGGAWSQQPVVEPEPAFETISIRPSHVAMGCYGMLPAGGAHYEVTCVSLRDLIAFGWRLDSDKIQGGNAQALDSYYDVRATCPDGKPWTQDSIRPMLRQMLKERFHVEAHRGTKQVSGYSLIVAKGGSKLKGADVDASRLGQKAGESFQNFLAPGVVQGRGADLGVIASLLSAAAHEAVVDHTGIAGVFNVDLHYAPAGSSDSNLPDFFTAVEEQLGLKLQPGKVTVDTLVIDHADSDPTPN